MKSIFFLFIFLFCFSIQANGQIVDVGKKYSYEDLTDDLYKLADAYPNIISYQSLTTTLSGRNIWAIKVGSGDTSILINGAHHAREWLTSGLLMKMIETYAEAYSNQKEVAGFHPNILDDVSIWFVPMVNPDGVTLQQFGPYAFPLYLLPIFEEMNKGSSNFTRWKANLEGVDLNRQYPANWEKLKGVSAKPSYQFYKGIRPLESAEVKTLVDFTYKLKPEIAVSYHSSGNVLFWGYHNWGLTHTTQFTEDYFNIAEKLSELTGYRLKEPASYQQGGGYTDWFIEEFSKPAVTIEIGNLIKENSVPVEEFPAIWEKNKGVGLLLAKKAKERREKSRDG